ncbi:MAG: hypothetical protein TREMPRED_005899 [Tremellales sp. Tagirdzhanova-0007]|nr:MAG: hypothetical protein TREMPRED_005899 [Tremellales sp. Tagirdzhanova-0007]
MATATAPAVNGDKPNFQIVGRLDGVPVVHDSLSYAQSILNSTQLTAQIYQTALGIAYKSYDMATPVLSRTKPILESADGFAVATFDRAEATFPYPFKTPTQDFIVVKQAKGVYDARFAPMIHNAQPVIQDVVNRTAEINSAIGARAHATLQSSQEISVALFEQMRSLAEHGTQIPVALLDRLGKSTNDVKGIVFDKDASLQDKSNKLGAYVVDQVKPIVDEIYNYNKAKAEGGKTLDQANGAINH